MPRSKFSDAPQVQQDRKPARCSVGTKLRRAGNRLVFYVLQHIEHNGVAYLPPSHHLVQSGQCPDALPSMGAKGRSDSSAKTVPANTTGMIDLSDMSPRDIFALYKAGTIAPVDPANFKRVLEEGRRQGQQSAVALIPPMKRVRNQRQAYEQATGVPLSTDGVRNLAYAQQTMPSPFTAGVRG